jgi:hypothetical protein
MKRSISQIAAFIRECAEKAEAGNDTVLDIRTHFRDRMRERGIFWGDVIDILLAPKKVEPRGKDDEGREQVWLYGKVPKIGDLRIVVSVDFDTRLITINWD